MTKKYFLLSTLLLSLVIIGCKSTPKQSEKEIISTISLVFAGDIMAHKPNYNMKNYNKIWQGISDIVKDSDLAFANLEAPVCDELPYSTYPNFNMHSDYPQAAIDAGFNVFSIINNHSNDQGLQGIKGTIDWAQKIENKTKDSERPVIINGLNEIPNSPVSYKLIHKGEWTILFCAITEILNRPDYRSYMNYVVSSKSGWEEFSKYILKVREENPCDLLILSIHTDEPEYISPVSLRRKEYYYKLLDECGVDIIYTNHPHIIRERELIGNSQTNYLNKAIIYGNGNLISGQRWEPDFDNPSNPRDDTGDGFIWKLTFCKSSTEISPFIKKSEPFYITTYINTAWEFVIQKLDDNFIEYLNEIGRKKWAGYIKRRKQISEQTKETIIWQ